MRPLFVSISLFHPVVSVFRSIMSSSSLAPSVTPHYLYSHPHTIVAAEYPCANGQQKIGHLMLNAEKALNAVDLDMVKTIAEVLAKWQQDDEVMAVILTGAGDRVFSAGGDVQKLYHSMKASGDEQYVYGDEFFYHKYLNNYHIHQFTKPIIAWGIGYVMGGGLGLFISSSHRVGTETLKLAWPELKIGLFPDVTATYYLSRLPKPLGHWMGLSASLMNAVDCKQLGLTQYAIEHQSLSNVFAEMLEIEWQSDKAHDQVKVMLNQFDQQSASQMPASHIDECMGEIEKLLMNEDGNVLSLQEIDANFQHAHDHQKEQQHESEWFQQGIKNYLIGCPDTAAIIMEQIARGADMNLAEVVSWELGLAYQSLRKGNFVEGIRALVMDKDQAPNWQHSSVDKLDQAWIEEFIASPWDEQNHPYKNCF